MRKTFVIAVLMAIVAMTTVGHAQNPGNMRAGRCLNDPEVKTYVEKNILPVMKMQRQQLDKELSGSRW
jgi:hypothetical protein